MEENLNELLLKDLCARLQYGIKGLAYIVGEPCNTNTNIIGIINKSIVTDYESPMFEFINLRSKDIIIKPYLRPMSSMTEEEKHKLLKFGAITCLENGEVIDVSCVGFERHADVQDYLNTCHFDYRGLIEKNLALEAPDGMYNLNEK